MRVDAIFAHTSVNVLLMVSSLFVNDYYELLKFATKQVCEKYLANGKRYRAFKYQEKTYDTIDLHCKWQMPRLYTELEENC